jgi:hypothetical protein
MDTIVVTEWHSGFNKVAFTRVLHEKCGVRLSTAKHYTDRLLSGEVLIFDVTGDVNTNALVAEITALGASAHVKNAETYAAAVPYTPLKMEPTLKERVVALEKESMRAKLLFSEPNAQGPSALGQGVHNDLHYILGTLLDVSPRAAILESWLLVEDELIKLSRERGVSPRQRGAVRSLIRALESEKLLSPELARVVRHLNDVRNRAVHELDISVDDRDASEFVEMARRIVNIASVVIVAVDAAA